MESTSSQLLSVRDSSKNRTPFKPQAREIIYNVYKYLVVNKKQFNLEYNIAKCTAEATGVSVATVDRIARQARQSIAEGNPIPSFTSLKKRKRATPFTSGAKISPTIVHGRGPKPRLNMHIKTHTQIKAISAVYIGAAILKPPPLIPVMNLPAQNRATEFAKIMSSQPIVKGTTIMSIVYFLPIASAKVPIGTHINAEPIVVQQKKTILMLSRLLMLRESMLNLRRIGRTS